MGGKNKTNTLRLNALAFQSFPVLHFSRLHFHWQHIIILIFVSFENEEDIQRPHTRFYHSRRCGQLLRKHLVIKQKNLYSFFLQPYYNLCWNIRKKYCRAKILWFSKYKNFFTHHIKSAYYKMQRSESQLKNIWKIAMHWVP